VTVSAARIDELLRLGLQYYGQGNTGDALRCWREVLAIDPAHPEARDYVATAEAATDPAPSVEAGRASAASASPAAHRFDVASTQGAPLDALVADAQRLLEDGDLDAALDLFEAVGRRDPARLDVQSWIEHARSQLVKRYRERLGDLRAVPRQRIRARDVLQFNLPAHAGFLLSLVDGETSVGDLMSLSGMDPFEALRVLHGLLEAGIVSVEQATGA
jgi:tetratricopeptide (TPR) repeat protein